MDLYACSAIAVFVVYMERVLGGGEVAGILAVSRHTVVKWIREGDIGAIRPPSGRYRVPESGVGKILEGGSD